MRAPSRPLVQRLGARRRARRRRDRLDTRFCRSQLRDAAGSPEARSLLPERHRGTREPHQRDSRPLDLGPSGPIDRRPVTSGGSRDVHVGMCVSGRTLTATSSASADRHGAVAVLASGGLDSAILVAELLSRGSVVHPIYVRFGLAWEPTEEAHLRRFLDTLTSPAPEPLAVLDAPIAS